MAGGLGGLGGFGNILGAIGQSLLTSPRENPFQGLPSALQSVSKMSEHQAALSAMSTVAEKLGVPRELAASPEAMKLFIDHINATKLNQLRQQAAQGGTFTPPEDSPTAQPSMSVPGLQGSSGISTTFNVAGGDAIPGGAGGGLGGLGGMAGGSPVAAATPNTGLRAAVIRGRGSAPSARNLPGPETAQAIAASAQRLGVSPVDLATVISYESAGTFNPAKYGGKGGKYLGLIQFGPTEQKQFGANPNQTVEEQLQAAERYLTARGFKPGMGILDLYSTINAGRPGRYNASDAANGGAPGTVADKVKYQMGAHRARALAMFNALGEQGGAQTAAAGAPAQTAGGDVPLPPPRPTQLASNDPNMPLPSTAMQRVMDEARARGIGQGGPDTGQAGAGIGQGGPDIGQSGAPLNQVAAGRGRALSVPIPTQPNIPPTPATPAAPATPTAPPPVGTGDTRTKAAARAEFQRGMNILAVSNGDPVLMKQAEIIMQSARKYLEPSDVARRVSEAGLMGTPVGRAIIGGLPQSAVEALTEQQVPGYVSPSTIERQKFRSAEEERAYQHSKGERVFQSAEEERQYRRNLDERRLANTIGQQALDYNLRTRGAELEQNKFDYQRYQTDRAYRQQVDQALFQRTIEQQRLGLENQRFGLEGQRFANTQDQQAIQNQRAETALAQQRELAEKSMAIRQQSPQEQIGAALNTPERAPNIRAGQEAEAARIATETTARGTATALTREAEAATNAGRMAARLMPALTQAREAYNELKKGGTGQFGGIGPSANNPTSRAIAARMPEWTPAFQNEMHRQRFDSAMAAIRSAKTAVDLKGQGPISNFERVLAGADLPDPASVSAKVVDDAFARLDRQLNAALELDNAIGLHGGQQPGAQRREEPSAPAPSRDGWIDFAPGVRVRRKP